MDTMITSEWGTPNMVKEGVNPDLLLGGKYGNALHVWDLRTRKHLQKLELGAEQQMVLELRPPTTPEAPTASSASSSAWRTCPAPSSSGTDVGDGNGNGKGNGRGEWKARKVITIPAEPADPALLPPVIAGFGAVPPLVTDINLSVDDRFLYVSCWGTGEIRQYDVSDPFNPQLTGSVRLGGIVDRTPHPSNPERPLNGAPQMVEVSRDGRRVYLTNSLYSPWDAQFYPDGIQGWMVKLDVARRRHVPGPALLPGARGGAAAAPGPAPGRRRLVRLLLLLVRRRP
jgi:methanethiol oxidase